MTGFASWPRLRSAALGVAGALALAFPAEALKIETIKSPGGIEAWLVREPTIPVVAIEFAFRGGASQDPVDKPGVANMLASTLDSGAGPYDSSALHRELDARAVEFRFNAGRDYFQGSLRVLQEHRDEAFELLRLMLAEPGFETDDVERVRRQIISALLRDSTQPNEIVSRAWWSTAFPDHPYGQPPRGTVESVRGITIDDLRAYRERVLARDGLTIAIVGDVSAEEAARLIDKVFAGLPERGKRQPVLDVAPQGLGQVIVRDLNVPQATLMFGGPGWRRDDPDFMAAYVVNHIVGGGSFTSRFYEEIRDKRGLAYYVYQSLVWFRHSAVTIGSTGTANERAGETLALIQRELQRMRDEGPTAEELAKAKAFLKGSFALGLDTSTRIASQLVQIQIDGLGIDYIDRRSQLIDAVTLEDARRVARRMLDDGILVAVAGRPLGITPTAPGG